MPLLEISIIPIGTDSTSFSSEVTNVVRKIEEKGLTYKLTPTATVIEGEIEQLWDIAKDMHQEALSAGPDRIVTNISIDHRTDKQMDMKHQVDTVEKELE
ncbi:MTH1187 family thiamine-binding protein [uncultured Metabacillus sp.]|uniref:MTH1187 family thiamine-binding protein n=1 Tax=Metabacillus sp. Hm71 TaxID=3450743 RepID=UPI0026240CA8|nr:MTH1187 family thiamine-binding protein [uncultured Metabacillus sp.]